MPDADLGKASRFGGKNTERGILLFMTRHTAEHLGQSIAYARFIGVVPPGATSRSASKHCHPKPNDPSMLAYASVACSPREGLGNRNQAAGLRWSVQSALRFVEPGPPSRARVFSGLHAPSAVRAPNAGIPAIVQRIVRKIVVMDIAPDFRVRPVGERVDLDQVKLRVPRDLESAGPGRSLVATDAGDPRP